MADIGYTKTIGHNLTQMRRLVKKVSDSVRAANSSAAYEDIEEMETVVAEMKTMVNNGQSEERSRARLRRGRAFHPIHNPDGDTTINFHTGMYQEG